MKTEAQIGMMLTQIIKHMEPLEVGKVKKGLSARAF